MPKISEIYRLGKTQFELDFVNIDPQRDTPLFLNPFIFGARTDHFSTRASRTIRGFFQHTLDLINTGSIENARSNFVHLNEPNETCLGMSRKKPRGNGMGEENAMEVFDSLLLSHAASTGLIDHLENTAIFLPGIGRDKVSDMTTNIIRLDLIHYTQTQCELLGIPLTDDVSSGFFWNLSTQQWDQTHTRMLVIKGKKKLLVPKAVVSYVKEFAPDKYHRHFALAFLQEDHLKRDTSLVRTSIGKNGKVLRRYVQKNDLIREVLSSDKEDLLAFTKKHPAVFHDFREQTAKKIAPIPNSELEGINLSELIDFLIEKLRSINKGGEDAAKYHSLMVGILELLFYPHLINPTKEREINDGRKRIDILFDNGGSPDGFIHRVQHAFQIPCSYIPIECKNYSTEIANPELDQMVGRLDINRGKFGIIVCRDIEDEQLFLRRCADSFKSGHGLIIPLTDADIIKILTDKKQGIDNPEEQILSTKAREVMAL